MLFRSLVVISGAAHGMTVEHASTFNRILTDFLARVEAGAAANRSTIETGQSDRTVVSITEASRAPSRPSTRASSRASNSARRA